MSNSLFTSYDANGSVVADDTTRFMVISGGNINIEETTEAIAEIPIRDAGTFSNAFVYVPANTGSVGTTVTLRKSQADTALKITMSADQTGVIEDTSNTVTFAATDEATWEVTVPVEAGTNNTTITLYGVQFAPTTTTDCLTKLVNHGAGTNTGNAASGFYVIPAGANGAITAEANAKVRNKATSTLSDLYVYVSANAKAVDQYSLRKLGNKKLRSDNHVILDTPLLVYKYQVKPKHWYPTSASNLRIYIYFNCRTS